MKMTINSLPTDILCPILLLVAETQDARDSLRLVCKLWNGIVESTGRFWSRFIVLGNVTNTSNLDLWKRQLARAGTAPLDVVWQTPAPYDVNKALLREQVEEIPFVRWRKANIVDPPGLSPLQLGDLASKSDFENLIELTIHPASPVWVPIVRHVSKTALRLEVLKTEGSRRNPDISADIRVILSRISVLQCEDMPLSPILDSSSLPRNISHLSVMSFGALPYDIRNVRHLNVHIFYLTEAASCNFDGLETLSIGDILINNDGNQPQAKFPNLRELILRKPCFSPPLSDFDIIFNTYPLPWGFDQNSPYDLTTLTEIFTNLMPENELSTAQIRTEETKRKQKKEATGEERRGDEEKSGFSLRYFPNVRTIGIYRPSTRPEEIPAWGSLLDRILKIRTPVIQSVTFVFGDGKEISRSAKSP